MNVRWVCDQLIEKYYNFCLGQSCAFLVLMTGFFFSFSARIPSDVLTLTLSSLMEKFCVEV